MTLKTLGRLSLEGAESKLKAKKALTLLVYLSLEGRQERRDLATLFYYRGSRDPLGSLSTQLRRIRRALPASIEVSQKYATSSLTCDTHNLEQAFEQAEFETVIALHESIFLKDVYLKGASPGLTEWIKEQQFRYANMYLKSCLQLARAATAREETAAVTTYADLAADVFLDLVDRDNTSYGEANFDLEDVELLQQLLFVVGNAKLEEFRFVAGLYERIELVQTYDDAVKALNKGRRHNLEAVGLFVGRDEERISVGRSLQKASMVSLLGMGGIGKTKLARQVAQDQLSAGYYPDGIFFIGLEDVQSAEQMVARLAEQLGVSNEGGGVTQDELRLYIAQQRILLVLDNFEHLLATSGIIEQLGKACPNLRVLITSREAPPIKQLSFQLHGLALPPEDAPFREAKEFDAIQFFSRIAGQCKHGFQLSDSNYTTVKRICELTESVPLVLELIASNIDLLSLADFEKRLARDLDLLATKDPEIQARQQSMRLVWHYSWELLSPLEQSQLSKLAVFSGGFSLEAAETIVGLSIHELRTFIDKSLLRVSEDYRYSFHLTLQQFVREKFTDSNPELTVSKHQDYYLEQGQQHSVNLASEHAASSMAFFDKERANIQVAWSSCRSTEKLMRFLGALETYQERKGLWAERLSLIKAAEKTQPKTKQVQAKLKNARAMVYAAQGDFEKAYLVLQDALTLQKRATEVKAETLNELGGVHYMRREFNEAKKRFRAATEIFAKLGRAVEKVNASNNIGLCFYAEGDYPEAIELWKEALREQRRNKDLSQQALILNNLGSAYRNTGQLEYALSYLEQARRLREEQGDQRSLCFTLGNIGSVYFLQGKFRDSLTVNLELLDLQAELGDKTGHALSLNNIAMIYERWGQLSKAEELLKKALFSQEKLDDSSNRVATLYNLSTVTLQLDKVERAKVRAEQALELAEATSNVVAKAYALLFLGDVYKRQELSEAFDCYHSAIELQEETGDKQGLVMTLNALADAELSRGELQAAEGYAEKALDLGLQLGSLPDQRNSYVVLSKVAAHKNQKVRDYEQAIFKLTTAIQTFNDEDKAVVKSTAF